MAAVIGQIAPRIIIPGFFMKDKLAAMTDKAQIAKTIAFSMLFVTAVITFFQRSMWLATIPGAAAFAYWNMLKDPEHTQLYRYADWSITTPLMLLGLLLAMKSSHIPELMVADLAMIGAGYMGVQAEKPSYKAAWFTAGMVAFVPILLALWNSKKAYAARMLTLIVWSLYPLVWALEETEAVSEEITTIVYAAMDMIAKIGLVYLLQA
jgi:bacteriorhodopsin